MLIRGSSFADKSSSGTTAGASVMGTSSWEDRASSAAFLVLDGMSAEMLMFRGTSLI
jgi:hypothetical protein